jgi:hypothetical protein
LKETSFARAEWLDERDGQVLVSLLDHKVLTTDQIKNLCFRSVRRCQRGHGVPNPRPDTAG